MSDIYRSPANPLATIDSRPGYWEPSLLRTENHQIGFHRTGTVVGTLCATAIATVGFAIAEKPSPQGLDFDASYTTTHTIEAGRTVNSTRKYEDSTATFSKGTRPEVERKETAMMIRMPDVSDPTLDLGKSPEAQKLLNPEDIPRFIRALKRAQAEGWTITRPKSEGQSSDEMRLTPDADIGKYSGLQDGLAKQYAEFVGQEWQKAATEEGLVLPGEIQVTGSERVSSPSQQAEIAEALKESGLPDNRTLIDAYKTNPDSLPLGVRLILDRQFERGAAISVILSREVEKPILYEQIDTRCVDEKIVDITTKQISREHGGNIPFFLLPVPILGIRQRPDRLIASTKPQSKSGPDPKSESFDVPETDNVKVVDVPAEVVRTAVTGNTLPPSSVRRSKHAKDEAAPITEELEWKVVEPGRRMKEDKPEPEETNENETANPEIRNGARYEAVSKERHDVASPAGLDNGFYAQYEAWNKRQRRLRNGAIGITALIFAGLAATLRLDAGYCPSPEGYANQDLDISKNGLPDVVIGRWVVPFTEFKSDDFLVTGNFDCSDSDSNPGNPNLNPGPVCDTRTIVYRDGKLVDSVETHYPDATNSRTVEK